LLFLVPRAVDADDLKDLSLLFVVHEDVFVEKVEGGEGHDEDQQVEPDQLEDAAMPDQHHLDETLTWFLRVLITVGKNAFPFFRHFFVCSVKSLHFITNKNTVFLLSETTPKVVQFVTISNFKTLNNYKYNV
jgi:hypothetical protein